MIVDVIGNVDWAWARIRSTSHTKPEKKYHLRSDRTLGRLQSSDRKYLIPNTSSPLGPDLT